MLDSQTANTRPITVQEMVAMQRRRFQAPKPFREGNYWWISPRKDVFVDGKLVRVRTRMKVCEADTSEHEAKRIASEMLRPMNQGLETIGSATRFADYVQTTYKDYLQGQSSTTQVSYNGTLRKYLLPVFGDSPLRNITKPMIQKYLAGMGNTEIGGPTVQKIKEVLSSVLSNAVDNEILIRNQALNTAIPRSKLVNKAKRKPFISPQEFNKVLLLVDEPYASMIYVCVHSGLRVSELIGLKWEDVGPECLTIDERCCRGDWSVTKTDSSSATIGVARSVVERIQRLKTLEVEINWGGKGAKKKFKAVLSSEPNALVFQSLRKRTPMNDQNILRRHLRPAALKLKIDPKKLTWRSLRRSWGTWMGMAGADIKSVQAQMRHARASTTQDLYQQFVPEAQQRAVARTMEMLEQIARRPAEAN
jgi:integrase